MTVIGRLLCKAGNVRWWTVAPMTDLGMFCTYISFVAAFVVWQLICNYYYNKRAFLLNSFNQSPLLCSSKGGDRQG